MEIKIKKMEENLDETDGFRIYVERHWPKNIEHEEGCIDLWLKDIAPGEGGQAWFSGKPRDGASSSADISRNWTRRPRN